PSRFPLDEKYKTAVTFTYNKEANHPITGEMMTHKGIDFKAPRGTPVFATANGVIVTSEYHSRYGKLVIIKHQEPFVTLYAHLDDLMVAVGETVKIGQQIGTVGNTGLSTGSHLHYEVRQKEENVDPSNYY
ncbi:MAG: M23 family metallopeptidase, partial [Bacteroidales bacterium]